jgi:hypothetical protein
VDKSSHKFEKNFQKRAQKQPTRICEKPSGLICRAKMVEAGGEPPASTAIISQRLSNTFPISMPISRAAIPWRNTGGKFRKTLLGKQRLKT